MNMALSQPIVKIWHSEDSLAILTHVSLYLDYLDVRENIYLNISFSSMMPANVKGITFVRNSQESQQPLFITVRIDPDLNKVQQRLVLAHEMIHVKQYAKGELKVISHEEVIWKGKEYHYNNPHNQNPPWEVEAWRTDQYVAKVIEEQPVIIPVASRTANK
jgi:hypothetical protein